MIEPGRIQWAGPCSRHGRDEKCIPALSRETRRREFTSDTLEQTGRYTGTNLKEMGYE
jgi:hypothetical protein